jgi:uncharacterized protein HemX
MKKLFVKTDRSTIWIGAAVAGALAAGAGIWFYLQGKRAAAQEATAAEHAQDYLKEKRKKLKKHKTDVHELAEIVHHKPHDNQ